jgi:hypothetical protein
MEVGAVSDTRAEMEADSLSGPGSGEADSVSGERCELCGAFTDERIGGRTICDACYEERSSCCPEFGGSDLWRERDDL